MHDVKKAKEKKCHSPAVKKESSIFEGIISMFKKTDPEAIKQSGGNNINIRMRSGSPGTRNNCDDLMKMTLTSSNPKAVI